MVLLVFQALPYDLGISYYFGYSPTGFAQNYDYTYHNISAEIPVPSTPFTLYGGVGFTDSDLDDGTTGYRFTDYLVGVSTSFSVLTGVFSIQQPLVMLELV